MESNAVIVCNLPADYQPCFCSAKWSERGRQRTEDWRGGFQGHETSVSRRQAARNTRRASNCHLLCMRSARFLPPAIANGSVDTTIHISFQAILARLVA